MSSDADIQAAIEAHRQAAADHDAAAAVLRLAGVRLCGMRPSSLEEATALFGYLATLGSELEPGLAELADMCLGRAMLAQRRVVKGPHRWWSNAAAD